jgi:hypothetical protein
MPGNKNIALRRAVAGQRNISGEGHRNHLIQFYTGKLLWNFTPALFCNFAGQVQKYCVPFEIAKNLVLTISSNSCKFQLDVRDCAGIPDECRSFLNGKVIGFSSSRMKVIPSSRVMCTSEKASQQQSSGLCLKFALPALMDFLLVN